MYGIFMKILFTNKREYVFFKNIFHRIVLDRTRSTDLKVINCIVILE